MLDPYEPTEAVDLIAAGYEWICPQCGEPNHEIEVTETVVCKCCLRTFNVNPPEHAYS